MASNNISRVSELDDVVKNDLCIGCGFCTVPLAKEVDDNVHVPIRWNPESEIWTPSDLNGVKKDFSVICPGKRMDMVELNHDIYGALPEDEIVGHYQSIEVGYSLDEDIRARAASGGVTTQLIHYLFSSGQIDIAYTAFGLSPTKGQGRIARSIEELMGSEGSHYHPVEFGAELKRLFDETGRFVFVGLPCEVAALRKAMEERPDVKERCVLVIGLFCGGINRFSGIAKYLNYFDVKTEDVSEIDYRSGFWPGQIRVKDSKGQKSIPRIRGNTRWNILKYMVSFQGYWMLPRCRICPDQVSDFADISVGDPHLPGFKNQNTNGFSAIVARSNIGSQILKEAAENNLIHREPLSRDSLVKSQGYTLENRRYSGVYLKMAKKLNMHSPDIKLYPSLQSSLSRHQYVYAYLDLLKIKHRRKRWLYPLHVPIQVFEYLFLTLSPRVILGRVRKLFTNK